jgi:cytoskeletal protein CcmA (bactofilin family)
MAKSPHSSSTPPEAVISIVGAGMTLEGDSETDGSLRVEGTIRGNVRAGKSVVIGKDGLVDGSIHTQDAVIAGRVSGGIHALSRLELLSSSEVSGEIEAPRMQVEEGAKVQGKVAVGESLGQGGASESESPEGESAAETAAQAEDAGTEEAEAELEDGATEEVEAEAEDAGPDGAASDESDGGEETESESEDEALELEAAQSESSKS